MGEVGGSPMAAKVSRRSSLSIMPSRFWSITVKACGGQRQEELGPTRPGFSIQADQILAPGQLSSYTPSRERSKEF